MTCTTTECSVGPSLSTIVYQPCSPKCWWLEPSGRCLRTSVNVNRMPNALETEACGQLRSVDSGREQAHVSRLWYCDGPAPGSTRSSRPERQSQQRSLTVPTSIAHS